MSDWAAAHLTEAVTKHELTLYGNGSPKEGVTTRLKVLEGKVEGIEEDVEHLIKWNHYFMAGVGILTIAAQFVVPKILQ